MNYILRYTGEGHPDTNVVQKVLEENNITVIDGSALPKMALIGNIAGNLQAAVKQQLPGDWELFPQQEQKFQVPDTRYKIAKK